MRDRSRAPGKRLRAISRMLRRRTGEAKVEVIALTGQTGKLKGIGEAIRRLDTATIGA